MGRQYLLGKPRKTARIILHWTGFSVFLIAVITGFVSEGALQHMIIGGFAGVLAAVILAMRWGKWSLLINRRALAPILLIILSGLSGLVTYLTDGAFEGLHTVLSIFALISVLWHVRSVSRQRPGSRRTPQKVGVT